MTGLFLFSTMPYMKFYVNRTFRNDIHYVWCSERYDHSSNLVPRTALPSPPTSDPAEICRQVKRAIELKDKNDSRLTGWRTSLLAYVAGWEADGSITSDDAQDLAFMLNSGDFDLWNPILYVINRRTLDPIRIKLVPPDKRAGYGREYIIEDLAGTEFEPLEL